MSGESRVVDVVLASGNAGKQRELTELLGSGGIRLRLASDWGLSSAAETGERFRDNAWLKARHAARHTGLPALADDSGLEVDALGGRPGVHSARYASPDAHDDDNNTLLLRELAGCSARTARYCCVLILMRSADDPEPLYAEGSWEGQIAAAPAGSGGFGYDPLFIPRGFDQTVGELPGTVKQRYSHRARAAAAMLELLRAHPLTQGL